MPYNLLKNNLIIKNSKPETPILENISKKDETEDRPKRKKFMHKQKARKEEM